jgi:hypothetical protein
MAVAVTSSGADRDDEAALLDYFLMAAGHLVNRPG